MSLFSEWVKILSAVPDFVYGLILPALLPVGAVVLGALRFGKGYPWYAAAVGAAACCLMGGEETSEIIVFIGHFVLFALLCSLLLLIPYRRRDRGEEMYKKFHTAELPLEKDARPPKICCYEPKVTSMDMDIGHALFLIDRLKKENLTPADRLELEALSRTVDLFRPTIKPSEEGALRSGEGAPRPLDAAARARLNDSLASILRLTAKYKL